MSAIPSQEPDAKQKLVLTEVSFQKLSGWIIDNHNHAFEAFLRTCSKILNRPPDSQIAFGQNITKKIDLGRACKEAVQVNINRTSQNTRIFFETRFRLYQVSSGDNKTGLITGYFEPLLRGSRKKSSKYNIPIYKRPVDLVSVDLGRFRVGWLGRQISGRLRGNRLIPYFSRSAIDMGALKGKGLELLWVDNAIDAFFLHIQGSGRVVLDTGEVIRAGFAGRNGHPYYAIGRDLIKRGLISKEKISLQTIRAWLEKNQNLATSLMHKNKSYIFFHELEKTKTPGKDGPIGSAGVPLTSGRSLAVDRKYFPMGIPIWINTTHPITKNPLNRLMIAQDTGGAIVGPVRGDFFWGTGLNAREAAGKMKQRGQVFILLPHFSE